LKLLLSITELFAWLPYLLIPFSVFIIVILYFYWIKKKEKAKQLEETIKRLEKINRPDIVISLDKTEIFQKIKETGNLKFIRLSMLLRPVLKPKQKMMVEALNHEMSSAVFYFNNPNDKNLKNLADNIQHQNLYSFMENFSDDLLSTLSELVTIIPLYLPDWVEEK
jgi:hypothetical protein